jgi:two-component system, OmpR family, sensor histidine kinase SenX3
MIVLLALIAAIAVGSLAIIIAVGERRRAEVLARRLRDQQRAEQEARAAAEQDATGRSLLLEALRGFADGVVVTDSDGRVVARNRFAERFANARHADALAEEVIGELLEQARKGAVGERELQLFGPPREVLQVRAMPLRDGGRVVGAAAFVRDVSEARRIESVRRDFVANVSHELKTPIGALLLLAETMAAETDAGPMRQLAKRLLGEADRLARIVDDLLDLSQIEAQEAPTRDSVPVDSLLHEAAERMYAAAEAAGIPLRVAVADPHIVVTCDRTQVLSAITNLIDNAVKYSEPGDPVELDAVEEGRFAAITVRDHGIGIPSRDLERIFERFYRVDRARSRTTGGTGLGLSIVRHVAQAHGGDVTVDSREGEGSIFRFRLPLAAIGREPGDVREAS